MHSTSVHALEKKNATNGGGDTLPIPLAYWRKPKHCYSTTAPNSSPSPGDYCRRKRHESASARFDTNRHPRNGPESRLYSRTRARTGAGADQADQSAGKGARKNNRPKNRRGTFGRAGRLSDRPCRLPATAMRPKSRPPACVGIRAVPVGEAMVACLIAAPAWPFPPPRDRATQTRSKRKKQIKNG